MVATVILGMLCVHLLCFCAMFLLISTRLNGRKMGTDVFAAGHLLLGVAYTLQLLGGPPEAGLPAAGGIAAPAGGAGWGAMSVINHTLTLCAPVAYVFGAIRFFNRPMPVLRPMLALAVGYTVAQVLVQVTWGTAARHALLAASCALLFLAMTLALIHGARSFAKDLRVEMIFFAVLVGGICLLNAAKFVLILDGGMAALDMQGQFQTAFYIYMSFLGTVLPPAVVWLILRRLTDELRTMATHDPLTSLLNRRGLTDGLDAHFRSRHTGYSYLLIVDIDHFKQINDTHGHQTGDLLLCRVAEVLQSTARQGDLVCRLGGEEFAVVALNADREGAMHLAERLREAIALTEVSGEHLQGRIQCTATIGVSRGFASTQALDDIMRQADTALYQGKMSGRNRVEWAGEAQTA